MSDIKTSKLIKSAIYYAYVKHKGQLDDNGKSYFTHHLLPVGTIVAMLTTDEEVIAAAYLHDVLEDTNATYKKLQELFGEKVAALVNELTHEGSKDEHGYYFPRLKSKDAVMIKMIDRASNLSRMECWDVKRRAQYLRKSKFWNHE